MYNELVIKQLNQIKQELTDIYETYGPKVEDDAVIMIIEKLHEILTSKGVPRIDISTVKYDDVIDSEYFNQIQSQLDQFIKEIWSMIDNIKNKLNAKATELVEHEHIVSSLLTKYEKLVQDVTDQTLAQSNLISVHNEEVKNIDFSRGHFNEISLINNEKLGRKLVGITVPNLRNIEYEVENENAKNRMDSIFDWLNERKSGHYPGRIIDRLRRGRGRRNAKPLVPFGENHVFSAFDGNVDTSWTIQYIDNKDKEDFYVSFYIDVPRPQKGFTIITVDTDADDIEAYIGDKMLPKFGNNSFRLLDGGTVRIRLKRNGVNSFRRSDLRTNRDPHLAIAQRAVSPIVDFLGTNVNRFLKHGWRAYEMIQNRIKTRREEVLREIQRNRANYYTGKSEDRIDVNLWARSQPDPYYISEINVSNIQFEEMVLESGEGIWTSDFIKTYSPIYSLELNVSGSGIGEVNRDLVFYLSTNGQDWQEISPVNLSSNPYYNDLYTRLVFDINKDEDEKYLYLGRQTIKGFYLRIDFGPVQSTRTSLIDEVLVRAKTQRDLVT